MKILIWQAHGIIDVYRMETNEDYRNLMNLIKTIATQCGLWIDELENKYQEVDFINLQNKCRFIERYFLIPLSDCSDSFETIYFTDLTIL